MRCKSKIKKFFAKIEIGVFWISDIFFNFRTKLGLKFFLSKSLFGEPNWFQTHPGGSYGSQVVILFYVGAKGR